MWWEIIPSAAVIGTVFWIVPTLSEQVAKALYNTPRLRDHTDGVMWNYFQRDRDNSYSTWFTKRHGQGVSEGCPYHSYGLEKIPDDHQRKSAQ